MSKVDDGSALLVDVAPDGIDGCIVGDGDVVLMGAHTKLPVDSAQSKPTARYNDECEYEQ